MHLIANGQNLSLVTLSRLLTLPLAGLLLLTAGCSAFRPHTQQLTVSSSVEGTDVWINGNFEGKAPTTTRVKRNRDASVIARKEGYEPATRHVGNHFNATGALDIIGTVLILLPGIGLLTPGAWSLDETQVQIQMFEKSH